MGKPPFPIVFLVEVLKPGFYPLSLCFDVVPVNISLLDPDPCSESDPMQVIKIALILRRVK